MTLAKKGVVNLLPAMRYYKKQIIVLILALAILFGMVAFCAPDYTTVTDMNGMTASMLQKVDELLAMETAEKVGTLTAVTFSNGDLTIAGQTISGATILTTLNELCQGIAVIFVCITFFISLMLSKDRDLQEEILKKVIYFVVSLALVWYAQDICYAITGIGTEVTTKLIGTISASGIVDDATINATKQLFFDSVYVDSDNFFDQMGETFASLGLYLQLLIPSLAMWVVSVIINVTCWSRAFEIVTLSAFSPLAFADASNLDHFGHGGGSRFIKNMFALSISGAIIVFIMAFGSATSFTAVSNAVAAGTAGAIISGFKDVLVIAFAEVGLILKAQSISKTLLGVG